MNAQTCFACCISKVGGSLSRGNVHQRGVRDVRKYQWDGFFVLLCFSGRSGADLELFTEKGVFFCVVLITLPLGTQRSDFTTVTPEIDLLLHDT